MKTKNLKPVIAIMLVIVMLVSLTACNTTENAPSSSSAVEESSSTVQKNESDKEETLMSEDEAMAIAAEIVAAAKGKTVAELTDEDQGDIVAKAQELLEDSKNKLNSLGSSLQNTPIADKVSEGKPVIATSIYFYKLPSSLAIGKTLNLTNYLTFVPFNTTEKGVSYSTSASDIATVSDAGVVEGIAAGNVTITAKNENGLVARANLYIIDESGKEVLAESVSVSPTSITLPVGNVRALSVELSPESTTNKTVAFSSSDSKVVAVSPSGILTAKAVGTATVTVKTSNGKTAVCKVTVTKAVDVAVTSISLSPSSVKLSAGDSKTLQSVIAPANASNKSVTYTSDNPSVASVTSSGVVTGKKEGTATVTAQSVNGKTATCKVTVEKGKPSEEKPQQGSQGTISTDLASQVVSLINAQRSSAGLNPVSVSSSLTANAQTRAKEISTNFSHDGWSAGSAEIIATGTPSTAVNGWMNSSVHRAIMLNQNAVEVGVGAYDVGHTTYFVAVFNYGNASISYKDTSISGPTTVTVGETVSYSVLNCPSGCTFTWQSSMGTNHGNGSFTATRAGTWTVGVYIYKDGKLVHSVPSIRVTVVAADSSGETSSGDSGNSESKPDTSEPSKPVETPKPTCPVCGSTEHTSHPTCPVCGSTEHTNHPVCEICGTTSHSTAEHPKYPVCGSTDHTSHPIPKCTYCNQEGHDYASCPKRAAEDAALDGLINSQLG